MSINGEIITFYSYKGGTGRTVALANLACLLVRNGKKVLVIDWDLESPGLHQYLQIELSDFFNKQPGLIDLFGDLNEQVNILKNKGEDLENIGNIDAIFTKIKPETYPLSCDSIIKPDNNILPLLNPKLFFFLKTGRFDDEYSNKVNSFQWVELFNKAPLLFQRLAIYLAQKYEYVLIDSRTGIADIASICTTLMPDKLVFVFATNHQNLTEAIDLLEQAKNQRDQSDDPRELLIYPLPSRIELSEKQLRQKWRDGYQVVFQNLFEKIYNEPCDLQVYFDLVQIHHVSYFSYGEEIAVRTENDNDRLSLSYSYRYLMEEIVNSRKPWNKLVNKEHQLDMKALSYRRLDKNLEKVPQWEKEQEQILLEVKSIQNELKEDIKQLSNTSRMILRESDRYHRTKWLKRLANITGFLVIVGLVGLAISQWRSTDENIGILVRCQQEQNSNGDCPNRVEALKSLLNTSNDINPQILNLSNANLEYIDLSGANLRGANFSAAKLSNANLSNTKLNGVNFSGADLRSTNFSDANLSSARLFNTKLNIANFTRANLSRADLTKADLSSATLLNANLESANLTTITITDTALIKIKIACYWQKADFGENVRQQLEKLPEPQEPLNCSIWEK